MKKGQSTIKTWCGYQCLMLAALAVPAHAQYLTVSGTALADSGGNTISNATISFAPVLSNGKPASYRKGASGGQVVVTPVTATVTSGAFSLQVVDTSQTVPLNMCYAVTVTDHVTGNRLLGSGYGCVKPSSTAATWCTSTTCNFDAYQPDLAARGITSPATVSLGTVTTGPPGSADSVSVTGDPSNAILNFTLPQGPIGAPTRGLNLTPSTSQVVTQPAGKTTTFRNLSQQIDASVCGQTSRPTWCSGTDIGAWVNAAIATLPAAASGVGGPCSTVLIPAGVYTQTTTIIKPRCVILEGQGPGTELNYTGSGNQILIQDSLGPDSYFSFLGGIRDIYLHGPSGSSGTAIYFGCNLGTSSSPNPSTCTNIYGDSQFLDNVEVSNFGVAEMWGTNAFLIHHHNFNINVPVSTGIATDPNNNANSGENIEYVGGKFDSSPTASGTWQLSFINSSFDVAPSAADPTFYDTDVYCVGCHFEAMTGSGPFFQNGNFSLVGGLLQYDNPGTTVPYAIGLSGTMGAVYLSGVSVAYNVGLTEVIDDATTGDKNISVHGLIGSPATAIRVMQSGYNLYQEGVDIDTGGPFYANAVANRQQYGMAGNPFAYLNGGVLTLAGIGGYIVMTPDGGKHNLYYNSSGFSIPVPLQVAGHINQSATNNVAGTCAMNSGTSCTFTLTAAYNGAPICIATAQGTSIAGGAVACSVRGTTVTITAATANSNTWGAMLIGNPN
jgi:hypothetical protein